MSSRRESPALGDLCPVACQIGEISMSARSAVSSTTPSRTTNEFSDYVFGSYHRILNGIEIECEMPAIHCANTLALLTLTQGSNDSDDWYHSWRANWYAKRILQHSANARDRRATAKDLLGIL
jgi:hypothetical protein